MKKVLLNTLAQGNAQSYESRDFSKQNGTYKIYFNGILQETAVGNAQCSNLYISKDQGDLHIGKAFTGKIDDILIYNRDLSATEVSDLFKNEPCCK